MSRPALVTQEPPNYPQYIYGRSPCDAVGERSSEAAKQSAPANLGEAASCLTLNMVLTFRQLHFFPPQIPEVVAFEHLPSLTADESIHVTV